MIYVSSITNIILLVYKPWRFINSAVLKDLTSYFPLLVTGDEFDLHDTEDCPTQAMPDIEEDLESKHTKSHGARGAVREYCTNCEIFGHSTENCDEEQTF